MSNDFALIQGLRQEVKSASVDFCTAYNEIAGFSSADLIFSLLENHMRIAGKLSDNAKIYSILPEEEKAVLADIHEFLATQKNF